MVNNDIRARCGRTNRTLILAPGLCPTGAVTPPGIQHIDVPYAFKDALPKYQTQLQRGQPGRRLTFISHLTQTINAQNVRHHLSQRTPIWAYVRRFLPASRPSRFDHLATAGAGIAPAPYLTSTSKRRTHTSPRPFYNQSVEFNGGEVGVLEDETAINYFL